MAPTVVYNGIQNDQPNAEALFTGQKIWFSSTVPQRTRFIEDVKANGGEVVQLEKQADICLYDHARKNPPPGMYSYRYVEYSVRKGQLEDLEAHKIGSLSSRAGRPVGSVTLASKGARTAFTDADDQMLWDWLKPYQGMKGSAGNVIYQQLEAANPRHTYQSWRDRWLKYVQYQNRDGMSSNQTGQQATAPGEEKPSLTRTPLKASRSGTDGASDFPRIVVEVPVKESPRRKRGRPPKVRQGGSDGETIHVASPVTTTQSPTPMKSMRKESDSRPQLKKTPISKQKSDAGSWEFSSEERNLLLRGVEVILEVPKDESGLAWENMAKEYRSHTAEQWKTYFHEVIVPYHHKQQKSQERKKMTSIDVGGTDGRHGEGDTTKAQSITRKKGKSQALGTSSEGIRQDRNGDAVSTPPRSSRRQRSPSFTPQSPADWKSEADGNRPAPNQSRKRSPAKTNSQESAGSPNLGSSAHKMQPLRRVSGVQQHESEDTERTPLPSAKRRKLSLADNPVLEIPSTPEHTQESGTLEDLLGTPTPRARRRPHHELERSFSPLFVSPGTADEEGNLPTTSDRTPRRKENMDPESRTSPISVHLVSDHDPGITSSSSGSRDHNVDIASTGSPTPEFETAPNFSQNHEDTNQDEFETAAEQPQGVQKKSQPNTQALFSNTTQHGEGSFDLGLPEPEGGWEAIETDPDLGERSSRGERAASPTSSTTSTSISDLDIDTWVQLRVSEGKNKNLLHTAAEATNLHKTLADSVYESLERGCGVPRDVRGVWTKEDDELLMGTDARGVERVERKHGAKGVAERWECLLQWQD